MADKDFDYEHYFDWAATTPPDQDILRDSLEITMKNWGNPSSVHQIGKKAKTVLCCRISFCLFLKKMVLL